MSDIVDSLRHDARPGGMGLPHLDEAADEIERLRARIKELEAAHKHFCLDQCVLVTNEQIDKAWARANQSWETGKAKYNDGIETLAELNIHACDGYGWRIGDDDE